MMTENFKVYFMRWNIFLRSHERDHMKVEVSYLLLPYCCFMSLNTILVLFYHTKLLAGAHRKGLFPKRHENMIDI